MRQKKNGKTSSVRDFEALDASKKRVKRFELQKRLKYKPLTVLVLKLPEVPREVRSPRARSTVNTF